MRILRSNNLVFFFPATVLLLGLLAAGNHVGRSESQRSKMLVEQFESDAALRFFVRDALAVRLQTHLRGFLEALAATNAEQLDQTIERAGSILSNNYGSDSASNIVHFFVATVTDDARVVIAHSYPRPELVGRDITTHPMLQDFEFSGPTGRIDQIGFLASRHNDLSFTSESPVVVRRHLFRYLDATVPVIGIVKINLVEMQRYLDSELRDLGPVPALEVTQYEPSTGQCLLNYRVDNGPLPCPMVTSDNALQYLSEKNGLRSFATATPQYVQAFKRQNSLFPAFELLMTLLATSAALLAALVVRARLASAERQVNVFQGSLDNKEVLTGAIHTIVADNVTQLVELARRVKDAPDTAETERRYLNIALSEMSQLRLAVDSKIMADRVGQGRARLASADEGFSLESLARSTELELKRLASEEGIETRVLIDEGLTGKLKGSAYWIESALLAFINASLTFTDQGFIELSLWTEASTSEEPELLARIRDTGVGWSLDDQSLDHPSLTTLRVILDGVGAVISSSPVSTTGGQEHVVRFKSD